MMGGLFTTEADTDGVLQRFDPRLKLLLLFLMIVTIFSARNFTVLFVVACVASGLMFWQPATVRFFLRRLAYLRWLLLFTLLLHLLLSPGRTLFGQRLLSYDGLLRGLMVDFQLILALYLTLFFAFSTTPVAIAWGVGQIFRPLQRFGAPVREAGGLLILVLHFIPQVFQLGEPLVAQARQQRKGDISARLQWLARAVGDATLALVDQAEQLACKISQGQSPLADMHYVHLWRSEDSYGLLLALIFFTVCWSL